MTDNVIQFPDVKTYAARVTDEADEVDEVFYSLCVTMRGLALDGSVEWQHCVEACVLAAAFAAKEGGWPAEQLQALFESVKVAPATDI
jgi:hypothetical protein